MLVTDTHNERPGSFAATKLPYGEKREYSLCYDDVVARWLCSPSRRPSPSPSSVILLVRPGQSMRVGLEWTIGRCTGALKIV